MAPSRSTAPRPRNTRETRDTGDTGDTRKAALPLASAMPALPACSAGLTPPRRATVDAAAPGSGARRALRARRTVAVRAVSLAGAALLLACGAVGQGTTAAASSSPADTGCGTAAVCTGFEDQSGSTPGGGWQTVAPDCQGTGTATVDTAVAHDGTRSIRVDGGTGYCNHVFVATTADLSSVGPVVYGRMWVRHTTPLPASHVTMVAMPDASQGGRALRIGGQNSALQWNRESDDATLPEQSPAGVALSTPLPTDRWTCVRFEVDTTRQSMATWLDDVEVPGLHVDGTPTQDVDGQWLRSGTAPRPTGLRLGWESYGSGADTVWYDDVALGSSPQSC